MDSTFFTLSVPVFCCVLHFVLGQDLVKVGHLWMYSFYNKTTVNSRIFYEHWCVKESTRRYPMRDFKVLPATGRLHPLVITVDNQYCATVTSGSAYTETKATCSSVLYGRTVRVTKIDIHNTAETLCDFEVLVPEGVSRCRAGRFGTSCDRDCNNNCGGGPGNNFCYQDTGVCYDGCVDGWWGEQCQNPCGICEDNTCDRETGTCLDVPLNAALGVVVPLVVIAAAVTVVVITRRKGKRPRKKGNAAQGITLGVVAKSSPELISRPTLFLRTSDSGDYSEIADSEENTSQGQTSSALPNTSRPNLTVPITARAPQSSTYLQFLPEPSGVEKTPSLSACPQPWGGPNCPTDGDGYLSPATSAEGTLNPKNQPTSPACFATASSRYIHPIANPEHVYSEAY